MIGCGGGGTSMDGNPPDPDAPVSDLGWTMLVGRSWQVPPGSADTYKCIRIAVKEDMWVTGFRAQAPLGTHHTVLTISNNGNQLGEYDCQVGSLDLEMLWASGVGTAELNFPEGVGMKLKAGQFVNLNLHLFNASDTPLSGTSGIEVKKVEPSAVVHEADMTFSGTTNFSIPSDNQPHDVSGGCQVQSQWNVFTVWPHMHQHATKQSFEITQGATVTKVLDNKPYSFQEQVNYPSQTMTLNPGDRIKTTCTFVNNTGTTLTFGDSSNEEMCFTGMYKWPAGGSLFQCAL
ncbi:MAG TPA: hypothetical protein VL326_13970 [Kofleriaceae bacterium]|nr:hypothetical protein [Kofleriaceae bacterium]